MKVGFLAIFLASAVLLGGSCRSRDVRTMVIDVPGMTNEACTAVISNALVRTPGVQGDKIRFDLENRTVTVTYDSLMLSLKNVEFVIADSGFAANNVPVPPKPMPMPAPKAKAASVPAPAPKPGPATPGPAGVKAAKPVPPVKGPP